MSTKNFRKLIKGTVEYVLKNLENNYILIGENTSGKSELLFSIMRRMIENSKIDQIYFIDSVNRSFHLDAISSFQKEKKEYDYREICAMRLEERTFNKMDSFGPARIESIYWMYEDKSLRKESKVVQTKKQYGDFSLTALSFASISIFSG